MANMKKESDLTKRDVNTKTPQTVIPSKLGKNLAKGVIFIILKNINIRIKIKLYWSF